MHKLRHMPNISPDTREVERGKAFDFLYTSAGIFIPATL